jgi:hypothetical protein
MRTALITALVLLLGPAGMSHAHVRSSAGYSDVRGEGGTVRYELSLETAVLDAAAGERSPEAYVLPRVQVFLDGVECEGSAERAGTATHDGRDHTRLRLAYQCPSRQDPRRPLAPGRRGWRCSPGHLRALAFHTTIGGSMPHVAPTRGPGDR